ncbi:MAG: hypothetical protein ABSA14_10755 [Acidimicrobiales bacterium]
MPIRLGTALIAATGLLLGPLALASSAQTVPHATTTVVGTYVPVTPFRIVDTRTGATDPATYAGKTLVGAASLNVQVTGVGTVPVPATASAAVLNITVTNTTEPGFVTVYPGGGTLPLVSNLNFTAAETVANLVTVPLSSAGIATIYNSAGSTDVIVDVEGYYTSTPSVNGSGLYNSISPVRALGALDFGAPVGPNAAVPVQVTGTITGVPATATAVVVNATAAHGSAASFLTVYPAGVTTVPTASNVNFSAGEAVANRVTVAVGTGGQIEVYNHAGTVDVDVDVDGYYTGAGGTGSVFVPLTTPVRVTDTRGATPLNGTPIAANTSESFNLATTLSAIPTTASSVVGNFTVISGDASGYLSVYPSSTTVHPVSSSVNWTANETVPNFTIADTNSTGSVEVYNSAGGTINLLIDVFGYFTASGLGPIMVSAVVTNTSIAITYNEAVVCPSTLTNIPTDFAYDWTGAASGGAANAACTASGDVLTLTGTFTLPGSTGGSIVYTAPTTNSAALSVSATSNGLYEGTQTLAVTAAAVPAIVSAYTTATALVITYNEAVSCTTGATVAADFTYDYTGIATGFTAGTPSAACSGSVVTITATTVAPPASDASIVYTAPTLAGGPPATNAVYATGSIPYLYAATQTVSGAAWTAPAMTAATVSTTAITLTYSEAVVCPSTFTVADFAYYSAPAVSGGTITGCTPAPGAPGTTVTLAGTFTLPVGATGTVVYTAPAVNSTVVSVNATGLFPTYPATQTQAVTATGVPAMATTAGAAVVTAPTIVLTYTAPVACPATGADADFAYYYQGVDVGGVVSGCTASGSALTLTGAFVTPGASATIVYTAPATSTVANAVGAAGSTTVFAATQTLGPSTTIIS